MKQIWIFFAAGTGGDGLANLIEHCDGVKAWHRDVGQPTWRVDRVVDGLVKFWAPPMDAQHCFRTGKWFDQSTNQLRDDYEHLVISGSTLVATSHDILLFNLDRSDRQDVLCRNQIKVLLDSRDYLNCHRQCVLKNLMSVDAEEIKNGAWVEQSPLYARYAQTDRSRFDHVIFTEDLTSEQGILGLLEKLGLEIQPHLLSQYQLLRNNQWHQVVGGNKVSQYRSHIENGKICFYLVD